MKKHTRAFTLIELLVVVVIIGILAAVAVPQYQFAVKKAQFVKLRALVSSLRKTAIVYYLNHGDWPHSFSELDADLPGNMSSVVANSSWNTECAKNNEMYCCLLWPSSSILISGAISCAKLDYSMRYVHAYANTAGERYEGKPTCTELGTDSFCRKLPGAVRSTTTAMPDEKGVWQSGAIGYYID